MHEEIMFKNHEVACLTGISYESQSISNTRMISHSLQFSARIMKNMSKKRATNGQNTVFCFLLARGQSKSNLYLFQNRRGVRKGSFFKFASGMTLYECCFFLLQLHQIITIWFQELERNKVPIMQIRLSYLVNTCRSRRCKLTMLVWGCCEDGNQMTTRAKVNEWLVFIFSFLDGTTALRVAERKK